MHGRGGIGQRACCVSYPSRPRLGGDALFRLFGLGVVILCFSVHRLLAHLWFGMSLMRVTSRFLAVVCVSVLSGCGGEGSTAPGYSAPAPAPAPTPTPVPTPTPAPGASASVVAGANSNDFAPASVEVARGAVVTWSFGARAHNVIFNSAAGAPANIDVTSNAQVARTFATVGTFGYDCSLHAGMVGTVIVR